MLVPLGLCALLAACVGPGKPASQSILNENRDLRGVIRAQEVRIDDLTRKRNALERRLQRSDVDEPLAAPEPTASTESERSARTERVLERFKSDSDVEVEPAPDGFRFVLRERVLFGDSSAELTEDGRDALRRVADVLRGRGSRIVIEGHTDNVKPVKASSQEKYPRGNIEIAVARALAVWEFLAGEGRIDEPRLAVVGYGPHKPRLPNDSERNRYRNRRVEIRVTDTR